MVADSDLSLTLHARYRGKIQCAPKVPVRGLDDYNVWYTPGVAEPCRVIAADPERVWEFTNRGNTVAIVSDGTRVLGLGDVGPLAGRGLLPHGGPATRRRAHDLLQGRNTRFRILP